MKRSDSDPTRHTRRSPGDRTAAKMGAIGSEQVLWRSGEQVFQPQGHKVIHAMDEALKSPAALHAAYNSVRQQYRMDERDYFRVQAGESVGLIGKTDTEITPIGLVHVGERTVLSVTAIHATYGDIQLQVKNLTTEQALRTAHDHAIQDTGLNRETTEEVARQQEARVRAYTTSVAPGQMMYVGREPKEPLDHHVGRPFILAGIVDAGDRQASRSHLAFDCFVMPLPESEQLFVSIQDTNALKPAEIYPAGAVTVARDA